MNTAPKLLQDRLELVAKRLDPSSTGTVAPNLSTFRQVTDEVRAIAAAIAPPSGDGVDELIAALRDERAAYELANCLNFKEGAIDRHLDARKRTDKALDALSGYTTPQSAPEE